MGIKKSGSDYLNYLSPVSKNEGKATTPTGAQSPYQYYPAKRGKSPLLPRQNPPRQESATEVNKNKTVENNLINAEIFECSDFYKPPFPFDTDYKVFFTLTKGTKETLSTKVKEPYFGTLDQVNLFQEYVKDINTDLDKKADERLALSLLLGRTAKLEVIDCKNFQEICEILKHTSFSQNKTFEEIDLTEIVKHALKPDPTNIDERKKSKQQKEEELSEATRDYLLKINEDVIKKALQITFPNYTPEEVISDIKYLDKKAVKLILEQSNDVHETALEKNLKERGFSISAKNSRQHIVAQLIRKEIEAAKQNFLQKSNNFDAIKKGLQQIVDIDKKKEGFLDSVLKKSSLTFIKKLLNTIKLDKDLQGNNNANLVNLLKTKKVIEKNRRHDLKIFRSTENGNPYTIAICTPSNHLQDTQIILCSNNRSLQKELFSKIINEKSYSSPTIPGGEFTPYIPFPMKLSALYNENEIMIYVNTIIHSILAINAETEKEPSEMSMHLIRKRLTLLVGETEAHDLICDSIIGVKLEILKLLEKPSKLQEIKKRMSTLGQYQELLLEKRKSSERESSIQALHTTIKTLEENDEQFLKILNKGKLDDNSKKILMESLTELLSKLKGDSDIFEEKSYDDALSQNSAKGHVTNEMPISSLIKIFAINNSNDIISSFFNDCFDLTLKGKLLNEAYVNLSTLLSYSNNLLVNDNLPIMQEYESRSSYADESMHGTFGTIGKAAHTIVTKEEYLGKFKDAQDASNTAFSTEQAWLNPTETSSASAAAAAAAAAAPPAPKKGKSSTPMTSSEMLLIPAKNSDNNIIASLMGDSTNIFISEENIQDVLYYAVLTNTLSKIKGRTDLKGIADKNLKKAFDAAKELLQINEIKITLGDNQVFSRNNSYEEAQKIISDLKEIFPNYHFEKAQNSPLFERGARPIGSSSPKQKRLQGDEQNAFNPTYTAAKTENYQEAPSRPKKEADKNIQSHSSYKHIIDPSDVEYFKKFVLDLKNNETKNIIESLGNRKTTKKALYYAILTNNFFKIKDLLPAVIDDKALISAFQLAERMSIVDNTKIVFYTNEKTEEEIYSSIERNTSLNSMMDKYQAFHVRYLQQKPKLESLDNNKTKKALFPEDFNETYFFATQPYLKKALLEENIEDIKKYAQNIDYKTSYQVMENSSIFVILDALAGAVCENKENMVKLILEGEAKDHFKYTQEDVKMAYFLANKRGYENLEKIIKDNFPELPENKKTSTDPVQKSTITIKNREKSSNNTLRVLTSAAEVAAAAEAAATHNKNNNPKPERNPKQQSEEPSRSTSPSGANSIQVQQDYLNYFL